MSFAAFELVFHPNQGLDPVGSKERPAALMFLSVIVAALWPASAVVAGNVLAGILGHEEPDIAVRRAVVGLLCAVGSAGVSAPALALVFLRFARWTGERVSVERACAAASRLAAPMWACGVVAGLPPIAGLGPEVGEALWVILSVATGALAVRGGVASGLEVRRRWRASFVLILSLAAALCMVGSLVLPAVALRWLLGAATPIPLPALEPVDLPFPPPPSW